MAERWSTDAPTHADYFESLEQQAYASRLGMWVFLTSETLLFAALFTLYAGYRAHYPQAFIAGTGEMHLVLGSLNTIVLIVSSGFAALAVQRLELGRNGQAFWLLMATAVLGGVFLAFKMYEYGDHIQHGLVPGGGTVWFEEQAVVGLEGFFTIYYLTTGLHALHVVVGILLLLLFAWLLRTRRLRRAHAYRLEAVVLYWHMVDAVWIFIWPLFYLMGER
jgi:cytochrome c oxidase subunit III